MTFQTNSNPSSDSIKVAAPVPKLDTILLHHTTRKSDFPSEIKTQQSPDKEEERLSAVEYCQ